MIRPVYFYALVLCVLAVGRSWGGPPLREEGERREKFTAKLKAAFAAETTAAGKAAVLTRMWKAEPSPNVRRVVFESLPTQPDATLDELCQQLVAPGGPVLRRASCRNAL